MPMFVTWIITQTAARHPGLNSCLHNYSEAQTSPSCCQNVLLIRGGEGKCSRPGFTTRSQTIVTVYAAGYVERNTCCICRPTASDSWTVSVSVCASYIWWYVVMVMLWCVRCRRSEECRYWSCPGPPVRRHPDTLDHLTDTAQTHALKSMKHTLSYNCSSWRPYCCWPIRSPLLLSRPTFSVISCEWCSECSLSRNILCCSELARRQVSHVDKVQEEIPGQDRKRETGWRNNGRILYFKGRVGHPIFSIFYFLCQTSDMPPRWQRRSVGWCIISVPTEIPHQLLDCATSWAKLSLIDKFCTN